MGIKARIEQARQIIKAFTNPVPADKEWFQHRVSVCDGCEYNSKNKTEDDISFTDKLKIKNVFNGDPMCTACGCCVPLKAGLPESVCGLAHPRGGMTPQKPLWTALKTYGLLRKSMYLENLTPELGLVFAKDYGFVYNIEKFTDEDKVLRVTVNLVDNKGLKLRAIKNQSTDVAIGQTIATDTTISMNISISTLKIKEGVEFTDSIEVFYTQKDIPNKELKTVIRLQLLKNQK